MQTTELTCSVVFSRTESRLERSYCDGYRFEALARASALPVLLCHVIEAERYHRIRKQSMIVVYKGCRLTGLSAEYRHAAIPGTRSQDGPHLNERSHGGLLPAAILLPVGSKGEAAQRE